MEPTHPAPSPRRRAACALACIAAWSAPVHAQPAAPPADTVAAALEAVSAERLRRDVDTLAAFGTRHTLSDTKSDTRGIGAARRWLHAEFERAVADSGREGDLAPRVWFDVHPVEPGGRIARAVEVVNVVCEIPGSSPEARVRHYYVLGHYDSRASDGNDAEGDAPGANDDASGVAACLELARVLSRMRLESTVVLMATAGEEQGLFGARLHALNARRQGRTIGAVLNNDTIGDPSAPGGRSARDRVRVFSEGVPVSMLFEQPRTATVRDEEPETPESRLREARNRLFGVSMLRRDGGENDSPSRHLARYIAEVARQHATPVQPMLINRPDRYLRGGDHTPFNELGWPAVRFVEVYENYDRQHQDPRVEDGVQFGDLPEYVDAEYLADVTRLNAAVLVHLANAPSPPSRPRLIVAGLTNDTTLRWDASPEPDVAGYEVVWRETTAHEWQHVRDVGDVTEATINRSKDNWFFGIRAYDRDGYRSPVVTPSAATQ
ncbi:MAG: M28 family metallopeptidase [Phycisphaerales bacterium]|nr:M28 family metallopeptidase [Phycisphaerales bacterium]